MDPRLSSIIELQDVLTEQREIEKEYNEIPRRRQEIQDELQKLEQQVQEAEERYKANEVERSNADLELQKGQESRVRKESQLHTIKNEREYKATLSEIENLDRKNGRLEERILQLMEQLEKDKQFIEEKKQELEKKKEVHQKELDELDEREKELSPRMEEAKAAVDEVSKNMQPDLYNRFLRVFNAMNGQAIAHANEGHCGGCSIQLTPRIMQVAKRGQDIVQCEGCSRFLYWDTSLDEEQLGEL